MIHPALSISVRIALVCVVHCCIAQNKATSSTLFSHNSTHVLLNELLTCINSNDSLKVSRFISQNCTIHFRDMAPMKIHQEVFMNFYRDTGGIFLDSLVNSKEGHPLSATLFVHDQNFKLSHAISVYFTIDNKVDGIGFSGVPLESLKGKPLKPETFKTEIAAILRNACEKDAFSGVVLIAQGSHILSDYVCGEASKSYHIANTIDTRFNLGSMNKMFTALSIMQLVEKNKIKLNDPIYKFIDVSWLPENITTQITIHHLLSHTSGLGSYFNDDFFNSSRDQFRKLDDYKLLVQKDTLRFKPGTQYEYSNTGMLLLGVIIEKASGQDYFAYVRENIYHSAGMTHTDSYELDMPVENLAIGYTKSDNVYGYENNIYKHVLKGSPAGGGYSTARDLHKFAIALLEGKLLNKSAFEKMTENYDNKGYGYGFEINNLFHEKIIGHTGAFSGISSSLEIFTTKEYISVVLSNYDDSGHLIAKKIRELIHRLEE